MARIIMTARRRRARPEEGTRLTEQQIQIIVVSHLKHRQAPGVWWCAIPNGGYRRPVEAKLLQGQGVRAGAPDLMFVKDGLAYFLELKAENGRASEQQLEAVDAIRNAGGFAAITHGLDRALAVLEGWQLLKGRAA